jgi:hypothetical protein
MEAREPSMSTVGRQMENGLHMFGTIKGLRNQFFQIQLLEFKFQLF